MKKFVIIWFCFQAIIFSQYFGERVTDQSFESSSLYFNSHYLNTYGVYQFKDVVVGLIDDPFLNNYLNPAYLPNLEDKDIYLYLDFRGDRTEAPIADVYPWRDYYFGSFIPSPIFDRRWFTISKLEPEPIVSFGLITYPLSENKNFFIGGSYQVVYSEDKFYSVPYNIYSPLLGYDSFNNKLEINSVPVVDRYSGKDEMINEAHYLNGFAGYKFTDKFSAGVSVNGVIQNKDGEYSNKNNDEYGSSDNSEWNSSYLTGRTQDYDHMDYSLGLMYIPSEKFLVGIKAGYLDGAIKQDFNSGNSYYYKRNEPNVSENWDYSYSDYSNNQIINHDGSSKYIGLNLKKEFDKGAILNGYYRYTYTDVSVATNSSAIDTSDYTSRWVYNDNWSIYDGYSSLYDKRTGTGNRNSYKHEGLISLNWKLNEITSVSIGLYVRNELYQVNNREDVIAKRSSQWSGSSSGGGDPYNYSVTLIEDKLLDWQYETRNTTYQIPIVLKFRFNDSWGFMISVNRILNSWKITDQTTAYFDRRFKSENGVTKEETNFGERYTQPKEKITENSFSLMAGFNLNITKDFGMQLLLNPEIDPDPRIAQWWLAFRASI
jgi:hypothetical protein